MTRCLAALFLSTLLGGCPKDAPPKQADPAPKKKVEKEFNQPMASKAATMTGHFIRVGVIKTAIVQGDLEEAKKLAGALTRESDEQPKEWEPYTTALREAATKLTQANTLERAAIELGNLGAVCGDCHKALKSGPKFEVLTERAADEIPHMRRHEWAINMMWDGLVGPSTERWDLGTAAFPKSPLTAKSLEKTEAPAEGLAELEAAAHELAQIAARAETQQKRASDFGSVLSTCAACHSRIGKKIGQTGDSTK